MLAQQLKSPELIELRSDLGGGKTTFVKGLAAGLGSKNIVTSPTFTLNQIYKAKKGAEIHHYDFYRLDNPGIMADQLAESLQNSKVITVVEWAHIVSDVLPKDRFSVEFKVVEVNQDERLIIINYPESRIKIMKGLEEAWREIKP